MRWIAAYIKKQKYWLLLWGVTIGLQCCFMAVYHVAYKDIIYCVVIEAAFGCIMLGAGTVSLYMKQRRLAELSDSIMYLADKLPRSEDVTEEAYRHLLMQQHEYYEDILTQMQKKEQDMEEYYSMWAHQIKTPIAAMRLLLQSGELIGNELEGELFRIEQYVDMVMQYVRLEGAGNDFVIQYQPLDFIIRECIRKYAKQFIRKRIKLCYDGTDCEVITDRKWMCFIVEQLLSNAVKYTKEGIVTISVRKQAQDSTEGKSSVLLEIADTGIGIAAEDIPRVCEKGYTGYNGRVEKHSSGIGLFLTKQMLTKLGHEFSIDSKIGAGTVVSIRFDE